MHIVPSQQESPSSEVNDTVHCENHHPKSKANEAQLSHTALVSPARKRQFSSGSRGGRARSRSSSKGSRVFKQVSDVSQIGNNVIERLKKAILFKDRELAERKSSLGSLGSSQPDQEGFAEHHQSQKYYPQMKEKKQSIRPQTSNPRRRHDLSRHKKRKYHRVHMMPSGVGACD